MLRTELIRPREVRPEAEQTTRRLVAMVALEQYKAIPSLMNLEAATKAVEASGPLTHGDHVWHTSQGELFKYRAVQRHVRIVRNH